MTTAAAASTGSGGVTLPEGVDQLPLPLQQLPLNLTQSPETVAARVRRAVVVLWVAATALQARAAADVFEQLQSPPQLPHMPQIPRSETGTAAGTTAVSAGAGSVVTVLHATATMAAAARDAASERESARRPRWPAPVPLISPWCEFMSRCRIAAGRGL